MNYEDWHVFFKILNEHIFSREFNVCAQKLNEKNIATTFVLATERQSPCVNFRGKNIIRIDRTLLTQITTRV